MKLIFLSIFVFLVFNLTAQQTGSFTDIRDGKTYKTVEIGIQIWMAENLNYNTLSGCWCYDNSKYICSKYGRLYDWETAIKVCPCGYHLPNDKEWTILINYLGGYKVAGGKLKATKEWVYPNNEATNSSGFSALPSGVRNYNDGSFKGIGYNGNWWSSTENETKSEVRYIFLYYESGQIGSHWGASNYITYCDKKWGLSVRCLKD